MTLCRAFLQSEKIFSPGILAEEPKALSLEGKAVEEVAEDLRAILSRRQGG